MKNLIKALEILAVNVADESGRPGIYDTNREGAVLIRIANVILDTLEELENAPEPQEDSDASLVGHPDEPEDPASTPEWQETARMLVGPTIRAEDYSLVDAISWKSDDKDNMEFVARASCYQVDALNRILAALEPTPDTIAQAAAEAPANAGKDIDFSNPPMPQAGFEPWIKPIRDNPNPNKSYPFRPPVSGRRLGLLSPVDINVGVSDR